MCARVRGLEDCLIHLSVGISHCLPSSVCHLAFLMVPRCLPQVIHSTRRVSGSCYMSLHKSRTLFHRCDLDSLTFISHEAVGVYMVITARGMVSYLLT